MSSPLHLPPSGIPDDIGPIEAVAFDLDGLMFNTEEVFDQTGQALLRRRGHEFSDELRRQMMGRRSEEAFSIMIDFCGLAETVAELRAESTELFYGFLDEMLEPMPGLFELLETIEARELPKGVATSSSRGYLEDILGRYELLDRFHFTLAAEDVTAGKPNPEIYLKAAERIGVDPGSMLVFEDSGMGTEAAAAAGAVVVSVPHRHSDSHDFSRATFVADGLSDARIVTLLHRG
jgi:HAD superfamily hydrolase (TIGR01509 family)